jgi:hypothetical protein
MKDLNLDEQIEQIKAGIMKLQGQLELLMALKQAGAVVQLPDESKPATDTP